MHGKTQSKGRKEHDQAWKFQQHDRHRRVDNMGKVTFEREMSDVRHGGMGEETELWEPDYHCSITPVSVHVALSGQHLEIIKSSRRATQSRATKHGA